MRVLTIQEKDLQFTWKRGEQQLDYLTLRNSKILESWENQLITRDNIHEISRIKILKNLETFELLIDTQKSGYYFSQKYGVAIPVFYLKHKLYRRDYDKLFKRHKAVQTYKG